MGRRTAALIEHTALETPFEPARSLDGSPQTCPRAGHSHQASSPSFFSQLHPPVGAFRLYTADLGSVALKGLKNDRLGPRLEGGPVHANAKYVNRRQSRFSNWLAQLTIRFQLWVNFFMPYSSIKFASSPISSRFEPTDPDGLDTYDRAPRTHCMGLLIEHESFRAWISSGPDPAR